MHVQEYYKYNITMAIVKLLLYQAESKVVVVYRFSSVHFPKIYIHIILNTLIEIYFSFFVWYRLWPVCSNPFDPLERALPTL